MQVTNLYCQVARIQSFLALKVQVKQNKNKKIKVVKLDRSNSDTKTYHEKCLNIQIINEPL